MIEAVGLAEHRDKYPSALSGGMQQRLAIAQALARRPRVLLLDEPFGALDTKVRRELRTWLRQLHDKTGYTTIFVTHDESEAHELADRVVTMRGGSMDAIEGPPSSGALPARGTHLLRSFR